MTGRALGRKWYVPLLFLAPTLILEGIFLFVPLGNTFILSFTDASSVGGGHFTGLSNIWRLMSDTEFWQSCVHTLVYIVVTVPVTLGLSLALALLVDTSIRGSGVARSILFSPLVTPLAVVALVWEWMFRSDGLVNAVLQALHVVSRPLPWLTDPRLALVSVMIVTVWKGCGLYVLVLLAALQNASSELGEAAEVDGAGWLRRIWSITLPQLRPSVVLVVVLSAITAMRVFTEPYVMTSGGPGTSTETIVLYLFRVGISPGTDAGYASTISLFLFAVVIVFGAGRHLMNKMVTR